jgi:hypothetical protein
LGSTLLRAIRSGSSGATVYLLQQPDGRTVATKICRTPRVDARAQAQRRHVIAGHLGTHLPRIVAADRDVLVTECPAVHTLAELINDCGPAPALRAIWIDVVTVLTGLWRSTAVRGFVPRRATRNHELRCQRGIQGLNRLLAQLHPSLPALDALTVNGTRGSWATVTQRLVSLGQPAFRVTCHGDPHAGNVLVDPPDRWYLIDWEWTGNHHDWRMMASHLVGSWYVQDLLATGTGTAARHGTGLVLDYTVAATPLLDALGGVAGPAFRVLTTPDRWYQDLEDIARHTALLLLREIPRAVRAGRFDQVAPLLGECVKLVMNDPRREPHPVLQRLVSTRAVAGVA